MKASLKKIKDCRVKLFVEIEPELVENRYREVLKNFQRQARLPGFREGKAPADLVEKKYSKEAEEELLKSLIPEAYHQTLALQKVSAVTVPSISEIQYQRGKKLTFTAEFEQQPEISMKNYKGIRLKRESADVTEDDVEKAMRSLVEMRATLTPAQPPPALDEELAKSFGKRSVEELREAVRREVARGKQQESLEKMKVELFQKLLASFSFAPPEGLVEKQKERILSRIEPRFREKFQSDALTRSRDEVKLYFILQKIAEKENIEVDEIVLEEKLQALAEESGRPIEEVRRVFEEDIRAGLLEKKTVDFLMANAKFEDN